MKYVKGVLFAALALALAMGLAACGEDAASTSASAQAQSDRPKSEPAPESEPLVIEPEEPPGPSGPIPEVVLAVDEAASGNIIQVPQIVIEDGTTTDTIDGINAEILDFVAGYEDFLGGANPDGGQTCEITAFSSGDSAYLYILVKRNFYPTYGTEGDIATFAYNIHTGERMSEEEAMGMVELPEGDGWLAGRIEAANYLAEDFAGYEVIVDDWEYAGTFSARGVWMDFFYVNARTEEGDPWKYICAYIEGEDDLVRWEEALGVIEEQEAWFNS